MRRRDADRMAEGLIRLWRSLVPPTAELTTPQAYALGTIVRQGPLRMGALASELGVTVATASRTVDALTARALVLREADPVDARAVRVAATAAGVEDQQDRRRRFTERLSALMDELSEVERRQLADSLETLNRLFSDRGSTDRRRAG
jgi:MarR family transcriptional regulator, 2-MHQ and catechol-resistance regulon repressor